MSACRKNYRELGKVATQYIKSKQEQKLAKQKRSKKRKKIEKERVAPL